MRIIPIILFISLAAYLPATAKTINGLINIERLDVKTTMPAQPQTWSEAADRLQLRASIVAGAGEVQSYLVVQIRQGNIKFCGSAPNAGIRVVPFVSRTFSALDMQAALNECPTLQKGTYSICVQFFNGRNEPISAEACKEFSVEEEKEHESSTLLYSPPQNLTPTNEKTLTRSDLQKPIRFSWSPVKPKPEDKVVYRLRIWTGDAALNNEKIIATYRPALVKDVDDATEVSISSLPACESQGTCRYVWDVQAVSRQGITIGSNSGYSQPSSFVVSDYIIRINDIKVSCTATPGVYAFSYIITNPNATTAILSNLVVTSSIPAGAAISSFSPPLSTTIAPSNQLTITGTISASPTLSSICVGAEITDAVNSFWKASRDTCINVAPCKCDFCESQKTKITIAGGTSILNANNTVTLTQPIIITTSPAKLIKGIRAELMYFEFLPESEDCLPCNKDSKTFGNFSNGTLAAQTVPGAGTHSLAWDFIPPQNFSTANNATVEITLPPTVKCCSATIRWCIRYAITFSDCTVCSKVVCYEKKKDGCANGNGNPHPNN